MKKVFSIFLVIAFLVPGLCFAAQGDEEIKTTEKSIEIRVKDATGNIPDTVFTVKNTEPKVVAFTENVPAELHALQQMPKNRNVGTRLVFTPTITSSKKIALSLQTSTSAIEKWRKNSLTQAIFPVFSSINNDITLNLTDKTGEWVDTYYIQATIIETNPGVNSKEQGEI